MSERRFRSLLFPVVALIAVGCYDPQFKDCEKACGAAATCPGSMKCRGGFCSSGPLCGPAETTDAGDGGDTGDVPADVPPDLAVDLPSLEIAPDRPSEVRPDPPDVPPDMEIDTLPDVPTDMEIDTPPDVPTDMEIDTPPDVPTDMPSGSPDTDGPLPDVPGQPDTPNGDVPPPWTPGSIPNLVLWLEGDWGVDTVPGGKISEWRDRSGLHNDAKQTDATFAPMLAAGPFAGTPGLEFANKKWLTIREDLSLRWGVFDFVVLVVFKATGRCEGPCILQQLYRKQEVGSPWRGPGLGLQPGGKIEVHLDHDYPGLQWLATPSFGYDSGRAHIAGASRQQGWPSVRVDGADLPGPRPSIVVNLDAPGANVYIGAHGLNPDPPLDFPLSGYIGAVVAVQGSISAADLAALESYLMEKYGVTPGGPP